MKRFLKGQGAGWVISTFLHLGYFLFAKLYDRSTTRERFSYGTKDHLGHFHYFFALDLSLDSGGECVELLSRQSWATHRLAFTPASFSVFFVGQPQLSSFLFHGIFW